MWVLVPRLSPSAQALEDWTSPPKWSLELAESVTWRGKQRASSSWLRAWKKGGWIRRLFTRMPEPSMADRGVAEWISSLPATRASRSASLAKGSQRLTQGTSGQTSSGSSVRHSQPSLSLRTSKDTSNEASAPSSVTLTNWGSMRSGEFTPLPEPEPPTAGTGCSSWPTAVAGDSKSCGAAGYSTKSGRHSGTTLTDACRIGPLAPKETGQESPSTSGRRLNPLFVEWLMGFREGWTACEPSETLSAHSRQLWLCGTSSGGCADG